jgi:hypothetical protein
METAMDFSRIVPVEWLPEETAVAVYELVAKVLREHAEDFTVVLSKVTDDGDLVGNFQISIRKVAGAGPPSPPFP